MVIVMFTYYNGNVTEYVAKVGSEATLYPAPDGLFIKVFPTVEGFRKEYPNAPDLDEGGGTHGGGRLAVNNNAIIDRILAAIKDESATVYNGKGVLTREVTLEIGGYTAVITKGKVFYRYFVEERLTVGVSEDNTYTRIFSAEAVNGHWRITDTSRLAEALFPA